MLHNSKIILPNIKSKIINTDVHFITVTNKCTKKLRYYRI